MFSRGARGTLHCSPDQLLGVLNNIRYAEDVHGDVCNANDDEEGGGVPEMESSRKDGTAWNLLDLINPRLGFCARHAL